MSTIAASAPAVSTGGFFKPRVAVKTHAKITSPDIQAFFQQLGTLFRSGTPLYEALTIASTQCQSTKLAHVVGEVAQNVAGGAPLYSALGQYPQHFRTEWVQVVKSGEDSGQLGQVLQRLTEQIEQAQQLHDKLIGAMIYPCVILVVAVGAVAVLLVKVVPTFAGMFEQFGKKLPAITEYVLAFSAGLQKYGPAILGVVVVGGVFLKRYIGTPEGRAKWHTVLVSLPVVGTIVVQALMQKFSMNSALLMRSGLPLLETIYIMRGIMDTNLVYASAMAQVGQHVSRGGTLADGLSKSGVFTSFVVSMCRIGEASGTLPDVMDEVAVYYRRKVEGLVGRLTGLLESMVIVFMGVTVAVILCAVYLPMFSMASGVS